MRSIWENHAAASSKSIEVIDSSISEGIKDDNIGKAFARYSACNYNPSQYYEEGKIYKSKINIQNSYQSIPDSALKKSINHMSANFYLFSLPKDLVTISFKGNNNIKWHVVTQNKLLADKSCELKEMTLNSQDNTAIIQLDNRDKRYAESCIIAVNGEKKKDDANYSINF